MTIVITVSRIETLNNSNTGAPRFKLHAEDGSYTTSSNESFCWGLMNGWDSTHDKYGRLAKVELTRAGRVRQLTWLVDCHEVYHARSKVEALRDQRAGRLSDENLLEQFRKSIESFKELLNLHRVDTGCTEFH